MKKFWLISIISTVLVFITGIFAFVKKPKYFTKH